MTLTEILCLQKNPVTSDCVLMRNLTQDSLGQTHKNNGEGKDTKSLQILTEQALLNTP